MATLSELIAQKNELDKLIEETQRAEKVDAVARVHSVITEFGLTREDIFGAIRGTKKAKAEVSKVAAKYRDPISGKEWSGRGLAPKWLHGRDRAEFLIG